MRFFSLIIFFLIGVSAFAQDAAPPSPLPPPPVRAHTPSNGGDTSGALSFAEEMPHFPGDRDAFTKYLQTNIHYPDSSKKYGRQGTVYIYFEVNKDGSISNARCQKGVPDAPDLCEEALRVINAMPNWVPGKMNGREVRVGMTVPLRFSLD
jgi:TonB family protein